MIDYKEGPSFSRVSRFCAVIYLVFRSLQSHSWVSWTRIWSELSQKTRMVWSWVRDIVLASGSILLFCWEISLLPTPVQEQANFLLAPEFFSTFWFWLPQKFIVNWFLVTDNWRHLDPCWAGSDSYRADYAQPLSYAQYQRKLGTGRRTLHSSRRTLYLLLSLLLPF